MVACPRYHAYGRAVEQVIAQQEAKAAVQIWCLSDSFWPAPALRLDVYSGAGDDPIQPVTIPTG